MRIRIKDRIYTTNNVIRENNCINFEGLKGEYYIILFCRTEDAEKFMKQLFYDGYASTENYPIADNYRKN